MSKISQVPVPAPFVQAFKVSGITIKQFKTPEAFERVLKKFLKRNHVLHLSTCAGSAPRSTPRSPAWMHRISWPRSSR